MEQPPTTCTESLLLANADVTFSILQELKTMGLTLAIDDFGTGYSSFNYLRQFRVSKLKIDRSFIRDVAVNPDDAADHNRNHQHGKEPASQGDRRRG